VGVCQHVTIKEWGNHVKLPHLRGHDSGGMTRIGRMTVMGATLKRLQDFF